MAILRVSENWSRYLEIKAVSELGVGLDGGVLDWGIAPVPEVFLNDTNDTLSTRMRRKVRGTCQNGRGYDSLQGLVALRESSNMSSTIMQRRQSPYFRPSSPSHPRSIIKLNTR